MRLRAALACAWLLSPGCGYDIVELAPKGNRGESEIVIVGSIPAWALELFESGKAERKGAMEIELLEPADDIAVPANLAPISMSWAPLAVPAGPTPSKPMAPEAPEAPEPARVFYELTLAGGAGGVRLYTTESRAAFPPVYWRALLRAHEDRTLDLDLRAVADEPKAKLQQAAGRRLRVAPPAVAGTLYLETPDGWLQTSLESGEVAAEQTAELPEAEAALDPSGTRMAVVRDGQLEILTVTDQAVLARLAADGRLGDPAWAPDGRALAVTFWPGEARAGTGSTIARVTVDDASQLGALELLAKAEPGQSFQRPSFSPDGTWLAFEGSSGPDNKDSAIFVASELSSLPKRLAMPSDRLQNGERSPCWIPSERADYAFIAFVADRMPEAEAARSGSRVWLQAIELRAGKEGELRSARPFQLTFLEATEAVVRPFWISSQE